MEIREFKKFMRDASHWNEYVDAVWKIRAPEAKPWASFDTEDEQWESRNGKRLPIEPVTQRSFACDGVSDSRLVGSKLHEVSAGGRVFKIAVFDGVHTDYGSVTYANVIADDGAQISVPVIFWDEERDDEPERFEHVSARKVAAQ